MTRKQGRRNMFQHHWNKMRYDAKLRVARERRRLIPDSAGEIFGSLGCGALFTAATRNRKGRCKVNNPNDTGRKAIQDAKREYFRAKAKADKLRDEYCVEAAAIQVRMRVDMEALDARYAEREYLANRDVAIAKRALDELQGGAQ